MSATSDPMIPETAVITKVKTLTDNEKLFGIELSNSHYLGHKPGQFVELTVFGVGEAPISICSVSNGGKEIELCVRTMGNVTNALHKLSPGAAVAIRGPYNRGFPIERMRGHDLVLVAGGLGLPPLRSLLQHVGGDRSEYGRVNVLYGAKEPAELLFTDEYDSWRIEYGFDVRITVDRADDTWEGNRGLVTSIMQNLPVDPNRTYAAVCGPSVMYKFVIAELKKLKVPDDRIFLSFERRMECGIGKCQHCAIGSKLVCVDGPVFSLREVRDLKEAFE